MKEYIIFGCGKIGRAIYRQLGRKAVFCFCDNWLSKRGETYDNKAIIGLEELKLIASDYIILCMLNEINSRAANGTLFTSGLGVKATAEDVANDCIRKLTLQSMGLNETAVNNATNFINSIKNAAQN